jgi:hypothetical protein
MSNIVKRLRDYGGNPMLRSEYAMTMHDAADEIERLQQEKAELEAGWQRTYDHDVASLKAEIKRLRAALREVIHNPLDYSTARVQEALGNE